MSIATIKAGKKKAAVKKGCSRFVTFIVVFPYVILLI
jgi:hypothetical protein